MKKPVKMAWNEPGGSKDDDPWGDGNKNQQGPPDLDEVVRNIQEKVAGIFGGKKKGSGSGTGGSGRMPGNLGVGIRADEFVFLRGPFAVMEKGLRDAEGAALVTLAGFSSLVPLFSGSTNA